MPSINQSIEKIRQNAMYRTALHIMVTFNIIFGVLSIYYLNKPIVGYYFYLITFGIAIFGLIYVLKTKKTLLLFWVCSIAGTILVHLSLNIAYDITHYVDFLWIVCCCLLAFWGIGQKAGLLFVGVNVIGILFFVFYSMEKHVRYLNTVHTDITVITGVELSFAMFVIAYLLYQFFNFQRLSQLEIVKINHNLQQNNQQFSDKVQENVTLVKEIHHRIKNNLQIIISLLRLQQSEIDNTEAKVQFSEAINRILVMSSIHQRLYGEKELNNINLKAYVEDLTIELKSAYLPDKPIEINVDIQLKQLDLRNIVPFGLLVNELISNSLKYAFKGKSTGVINISVQPISDFKYAFTYSDNGQWKTSESNGFGLELIEILTEQLNGKQEIHKDETGTNYKFELEILGQEVHV